MIDDRTPFERVTDELTDGCGCACNTDDRAGCPHCPPLPYSLGTGTASWVAYNQEVRLS